MRVTAAFLAAASITLVAPARPGADQVAPPTPPPAIFLVEAVGEHNTIDLGVVDLSTGKTTALLSDLPSGVNQQLAVDAATRRWALTFHQLSNGDPLVIDGKALTEPSGVHGVISGQLDTPGVTVLAGDPKCHSKKVACFETPLFFAAGGQVLITRSEGSSWWMWNRRVLAPGAKPVPIIDRRLAATAGPPAVSADGKRAAYQGKRGGLFVTPWPALTTAPKPAVVKAAKKKVAAPPMIMSDLGLFGDHIFYFRRNPDDQSIGFIAAWDLTRKTEIEVHRLSQPYGLWHHRFFATPRGTVVFQDDVAFERAELHEVSLTTWEVTRNGADIRELLDVSADGRFALAAAYAEPDPQKRKVFDQALVVIELATGKELSRTALPAKLAKIYDARFVAPAR